ncbi:2TM domain-containing protein [Nocardioides sediminis]|uniref:2TM domain-containing protein n=1 Tax=Nocardioides sediminis TaxID=433648 RepID=UPI000D310DE6|nr:2TM domain-containing protein [Nocardioides sediminis]
MSTPNITLPDYEAAERVMAHEEANTGLAVHGIVTVLVSAGLIVLNVIVAPEFPWSAFAVGGMLIGLVAHWWFGHVKLDEQITKRHQETEARAARMR